MKQNDYNLSDPKPPKALRLIREYYLSKYETNPGKFLENLKYDFEHLDVPYYVVDGASLYSWPDLLNALEGTTLAPHLHVIMMGLTDE